MKRDFLKGLGLEDGTIDQIMKEHGSSVAAFKNQAKQADTDIEELQKHLKARDTQLENLKKVAGDSEELQKQINDLQAENRKLQEKFDADMKQKIFDFTLDRALMEAKSKNAKAVRALLNTEAITLDGETLIGPKDQLDKLKETDAYLFEGEQPGQGQQQQQTNNHSPGGTQRTNQKPPNNDAAYAAGTGTYRSEGNSLNKLK